MKTLGVFLSLILALTGLIMVYLFNISSTTSLVWGWNGLALIGILMGIARYKIFDNSAEDESKLILIIIIALILNSIQLAIALQLPISSLETVLSGGFILTVMSLEEPTYFLLFTFSKRPSEEKLSS